jgi:uncharacterized protein YcbX
MDRPVGAVAAVFRYPVKSMLGETCQALDLGAGGLAGDRVWAVIDRESGKVASAKRPRLWRALLGCAARTDRDGRSVAVTLPDGAVLRADDPALEGRLSALLGRPVRLATTPPDAAELDRSHPDAVLAEGEAAEVGQDVIRMGAGSPPGTFFDFAPIHVLTSATLDSLSAGLADGTLEAERYRPNIVIRTGEEGLPENGWIDGTLHIGATAVLRVVLATPRCAIPTLAHGAWPGRAAALTAAVRHNTVDIPGFGRLPCAGVYASVLAGGTIGAGDTVRFTPA